MKLTPYAKARIKDYYQLTKPGIIYGNMLSVIAGFLLASTSHFNFFLFLSTVISISLIMASGCVFNNIIDRSIDSKMDRTQHRAIVMGRISVLSAFVYGLILTLIGFALLAATTNDITVILGVIALVDYVGIYGLAKRKTIRSTEIGAIAGALPPVAGFTAVSGSITTPALLLFLALVTWQMAHFYAIALFRQKEYLAAGLPVISVKRGALATRKLIIIYIVTFLVSIFAFSAFGYTGTVFTLAVGVVSIWWLIQALKKSSVANIERWARRVFKSSLIVLLVFCLFVAFGNHLG
jgi:protoheme IX farnesyltransferase